MVEKPGQTDNKDGGTIGRVGPAYQTDTASDENAKEQTLMTIEEVVRPENMWKAYRRVMSNKGAAGVDGMEVGDLAEYLRREWPEIKQQLLDNSYKPKPVRKVEIPKPGGKGKRMLGIPCVLDRLIQQAVLQVLQPYFDPTFSEASYGFRPGRSAQQAVQRAREYAADGYNWVVDMDLEKFFDRVQHDVLMNRLARRIEDKKMLKLIRSYLSAGIMEGGLVSPRREGMPQGGPLSPLLSNVLLDELDKELERRGHKFVRYADDSNIYVRSEKAGERVLRSLKKFLWEQLRLVVNEEKSAVGRPWERKFLGYTMTRIGEPKLKIAPESIKRLKQKLKERFRMGRGRRLQDTIKGMAALLRGWIQYFRYAQVQWGLTNLDRWIRRRARWILWRQWKQPKTREREMIKRGTWPRLAKLGSGNGYGPWRNSAMKHMNQAVTNRYLHDMGLVSLVETHRRLACLS